MKDRQRTVTAALVMCLNISVDPPDVIKTSPCAVVEAWVDPTLFQDPKKALDAIGKHLQLQYEVLSTRTRYKQSLDPSVDDIKRFCIGLRRSAKEERVLFHYNGHGVPRPTASGEIWVFNRGYTQYIPVSLYDLQTWLGAPCIFVYDCHAAGFIVSNFLRFVEKRKVDEANGIREPGVPPAKSYEECIHLAACASDETLPMSPDLPADLFTACLTTPIEIAVKWFILQSPLSKKYYKIDKIPGKISERRTPLGELNWIFTSITDTIAWTLFPRPLFKRLFRQDLVVAALFRNFLLAERIMRVHNCHPISYPSLPATWHHPMWDSWDLAVDQCLSQINEVNLPHGPNLPTPSYEYKHSTFFEEQLSAFESWLEYKSTDLEKPPEQLPVVLQVLLSHVHRLRALYLLSRYLDLGPKAVNLALSIGIFPYVLKLLQSPAGELKPVLVYIWARIMSVDAANVRQELIRDNSFAYFVHILIPQDPISLAGVNVSDQRAMCALIITLFCREFKLGQQKCLTPSIMHACVAHTMDPENPLLRQWSCLCLAQLWDLNNEGKLMAIREGVLPRLSLLLKDPVPEVRTACLISMTNFLSCTEGDKDVIREHELKVTRSVLALSNDVSSLVRRELVVFFSKFVKQYLNYFLVCAYTLLEEEASEINPNEVARYSSPAEGTVYMSVWKLLLILSEDPFKEVADYAQTVVDHVLGLLDSTILRNDVEQMENKIKYNPSTHSTPSISTPASNDRLSQLSRTLSSSQSPESRLTSTLKRSVSFAASLRQYAWGESTFSSTDSLNFNSVSNIPYGFGLKPSTPRYKPRSRYPIELPLSSGFLDWATEYFHEPQFRHSDIDEPGSERYTERLWRKNHNERIMAQTQLEKELSLTGAWVQSSTCANQSQPTHMTFAQFEPHLAVVDDQDGVTIWDWSTNKKLNRFCNMNPVHTKITQAKFLNEDDVPLLLTGSSEGVVRIYRHYESEHSIELVSAWRALTNLLPVEKSSGLITDWQQSRGTLLVGGDVRIIRVWDASRELCVADIPARSGSPITSLTSDQVAGQIVVAGFGDGAVRVYDRRLDPHDSMVQSWRSHQSWVLNARMQRGGARELVSGSIDGTVCLWDIRLSKPIDQFQAGNGLTAFDVHEHAPIIAAASSSTQLYSTLGNKVPGSPLKISHTGYGAMLAGRGGTSRVSNLAFHPHRMMFVVTNKKDSHIGIFKCFE